MLAYSSYPKRSFLEQLEKENEGGNEPAHVQTTYVWCVHTKLGKGFPYSLPSVGPEADPGVQAVYKSST